MMSKKLIIFVCTLCLAGGSAQAVNILNNGNFETGDLTGWTWTWPTDQTYTVQTSVVYEGTYALLVQQISGSDWAKIGQDPDIGAGVAYTLSCAFNSSSADNGIAITYKDSSWTDIGWEWVSLGNSSGSWQTYSNNFTTVAGTAHMDIALQSGMAATYYDAVVVTPEPATMLLLGLGSLTLRRRKRA
jgi:hypothetical protein